MGQDQYYNEYVHMFEWVIGYAAVSSNAAMDNCKSNHDAEFSNNLKTDRVAPCLPIQWSRAALQ